MQLNTMIKNYFYRLCFSVRDVNDKVRRKLVKKTIIIRYNYDAFEQE